MRDLQGVRSRPHAAPAAAISLALAIPIALAAPAAADLTGKALDARIRELTTEYEALRAESKELSGSSSPAEGARWVRNEYYGLKVRSDELDEVIEKTGGTQKELERYRDQMDDEWVVDEGDVAGEAVEKGVEEGARRVVSRGAGRALGWLGIALDAGEYGGKWILKEGDVDALEDAVEQNRVNLHDLYEVASRLQDRINGKIRDMGRLVEIRKHAEEIYPELARLRARKRELETPATRHAVTDRVTDAEGDAEEAKAHSEAGAKRGISTVGPPAPPIPKGISPAKGISPGRTIQPDMPKPQPQVPRGRGGRY